MSRRPARTSQPSSAPRTPDAAVASPASPASPEPAAPLALPTLEQRIERQAYALGFDLVGFVRLAPAETAAHFDDWIAAGRHGDMGYMARDVAVRHDTRRPHPGAVSAVVVAMDYGGKQPTGPVARYARGDDYHDVMRDRLRSLHAFVTDAVGHEVDGRAYVDTAPILERDLARRAGLGWFGKNTNLINPKRGSYFFLGSLFLAIDLAPSDPFEGDKCAGCTRCLKACPTEALTASRELDATRCISYLTIENRGSIPEALREQVGSWLYGCDVCQEVCPWNVKFAVPLAKASPYEARSTLGGDARTLALRVLAMTHDDFVEAFRGSAMKRAKLAGLKRNAAVVLGNVGSQDDIDALEHATIDTTPVVAEHATWAIAQIRERGGQRAPDSPAAPDRSGRNATPPRFGESSGV